MARYRPSKILASRHVSAGKIPGDVIHVDDIGIHVVRSEERSLRIYPHRPGYDRCISYKCDCPSGALVHSANGTYTVSTSVLTVCDDKLIQVHNFPDTTMINAFTFHPYRFTHLAALSVGDIAEFDINSKWMQHIRPGSAPMSYIRFPSDIYSIQPSTISTNIYIGWRDDVVVGISIIRENQMANYPIDVSHVHPILLARPKHPDILTLLHGPSITSIDLWHSSPRSKWQTWNTCNIHHGVYIDPNVCVMSGDYDVLCVFDHRCGVINRRQMAAAGKLWFVHGLLYIEGRDGAPYVLEI